MKIDVWVDYICPFCYIGKRNLDLALEKHEGEPIEVELHGYMLNPELPKEPTKTLNEYVAEKYGKTEAQAQTDNTRIEDMAKAVGLPIDFSKTFMINTQDAHRLHQFAKTKGLGTKLFDRIQRAYYSEGILLSDHDTLAAYAEEIGLDRDEAMAVLADESRFLDELNADLLIARQIGISGVPFFVIDKKLGLSGAQPHETILSAIEQASQA